MKPSISVRKYCSRGRKIFREMLQRILLKPALNLVLKIRIVGRENLAKINPAKPLIIVANHNSHFDAPLILTSLPRKLGATVASAAAADYFFANKSRALWSRIFFNTFPVDRDGSGAHRGLSEKILASQIPLLIFPEGTRSRDGELGEWHSGAARLALKSRAAILPVTLVGTFAAWSADRTFWRRGRPAVKIMFREIIKPEIRETAEHLTARLRNSVAAGLARN